MHTHVADEQLLQVLKQIGVDFKKPREINFYFVFTTEFSAAAAARVLEQKKLSVEKFQIDPPWWKRLFVKPTWTLAVTRQMPLDEAKIKSITTVFQQVATAHNGSYDGWEANVAGEQLDESKLKNL